MAIAPRETRLHRAVDLADFRQTLVDLIAGLAPVDVGDAFVIVPSRAAAEQLRRTVEDLRVATSGGGLLLPPMGTRADWYAAMGLRLRPRPRVLDPFEREVMLAAAARETAASGVEPPFQLRPGLLAEILGLYDHLHRLGRSVEVFDRNVRGELEKGAGIDRGAERLLQQTDFLVAAFARYADRRERSGAVDEGGLRARLLAGDLAHPIARVIVAVGDRVADTDGLWPADFDLLTRLEGLAHIDFVATEETLGVGYLDRIGAALPGIDVVASGRPATPPPTLEVPRVPALAVPEVTFVARDREDELAAFVRRLKTRVSPDAPAALDRIGVVVRRPLPYLYLARETFGSAGVPFETLDTLPLAAEPYAAAVDLVLTAIVTDYARKPLIALLQSPHVAFGVPRAALAALDRGLAEARYQGGPERLASLFAAWRAIEVPASRDERRQHAAVPALAVAAALVGELTTIAGEPLVPDQIDRLVVFLETHHRAASDEGASDLVDADARQQRVRSAVLVALRSLAQAYRAHDPEATGDTMALAASIKRWLGARTFASRTGSPGVQIVDAQAARFGLFDELQIVGLINGEWPEPVPRNVLYPASLMQLLEPDLNLPRDAAAREREGLDGARAAFRDLLRSATRHVRLSRFLLEHDAVVEPSPLVDEVARVALPTTSEEPAVARVFLHDALTSEPLRIDALPDEAAAWARVRLEGRPDPARFTGRVGAWRMPRVSVSRLERYLDCPFRFFASEVLRLEEEPEDEDTRTPLERGRFLHELFERFFATWKAKGQGRITPQTLPQARRLFESLCEEALATLPPAEAALERARLLGSAVSAGIAHRVLTMEAERPTAIVDRLLEYPLEGAFTFRGPDERTRTIALSAKADRIDLLEDGTLRVIDYKSRLTPDVKRALQLPIYSHCTRDRVQGHGRRNWTLGEALYLSFEGSRSVVPLRVRDQSLDDLVDAAQGRLIDTLDAIADGAFPAQPARRSLCQYCPYSSVCRLEWTAPADE